jgi:hypothetical protein
MFFPAIIGTMAFTYAKPIKGPCFNIGLKGSSFSANPLFAQTFGQIQLTGSSLQANTVTSYWYKMPSFLYQ